MKSIPIIELTYRAPIFTAYLQIRHGEITVKDAPSIPNNASHMLRRIYHTGQTHIWNVYACSDSENARPRLLGTYYCTEEPIDGDPVVQGFLFRSGATRKQRGIRLYWELESGRNDWRPNIPFP